MRATNIQWDTDGDENIAAQLPTEIQIPGDISPGDAGDYISDQTGFCHFGFRLEPDSHIRSFPVSTSWLLPEGFRWSGYVLNSTADLADVCRVLYGDCSYDRIKHMKNAAYPCTAIFAISEKDPGWGRCMGDIQKLRRNWNNMTANIEIDARPSAETR